MAPDVDVSRDTPLNDARLQAMAEEAVGDVLAEQRKQRLKPAPAPPRLQWRPILAWPLFALAAAALIVCGPWNPRRTAAVPAELWGLWATTAPGYANHGFAIRERSVTFYSGGPDSSTVPIRKVRSKSNEGGTIYVLGYERLGEPYAFSFRFSPERGGVIQFGDQPDLTWQRSAHLAGADAR